MLNIPHEFLFAWICYKKDKEVAGLRANYPRRGRVE